MRESDLHNAAVRFMFEHKGVRGEAVHLQEPFTQLFAWHNYPDCVRKLLMEQACAAVLMAAGLKADSEIMVQIRGGKDAPLKYSLINISSKLSFYGSAGLREDCQVKPDASLSELCGKDGCLIISIMPKDGNRWQGIVPLDTGSIGKALEQYFSNSEQLPSSFFIFADVKQNAAGGLMLQIIPDIKNNHEDLQHLSTLASTLSAEEIITLPLYETLRRLYWNDEAHAYAPQPVRFACVCSRDRCLQTLKHLAHKDLQEIASDPKGMSMTCQHCGKIYKFTQEELQKILAEVSQ